MRPRPVSTDARMRPVGSPAPDGGRDAEFLAPEELASLRKLDPLAHARLLFFPALWAAGAGASLWAIRQPFGPLAAAAWLAGAIASALALNAAFLAMHEGTHYLLSRDRARNRWLGFLTGLPLFLSFTAYQALHIRHHEFLGDPRDPDDYDNYTGHPAKVWMLHWLRLLAAAYLYLLLVPALAWKHGTSAQRRGISIDYALLSAFYAAVFSLAPFPVLAHAWLLPTAIANVLINVRGLTQHSLAEARDPLLASRSVRTRPWVAFLYLNENYHLEHHLYPGVPFYHLPRLHALLEERLPRALVVPSYSAFLWSFLKATWTGERHAPMGRIVVRAPADAERGSEGNRKPVTASRP
jgi:fatty acid desaturase